MKLTAQDLQIGDWVLYENEPNIIAEVSEIVQGEAEVCFAVTNYMANIDEIKPMPLTPEILEKNGFEKSAGKGYYRNKDYNTETDRYLICIDLLYPNNCLVSKRCKHKESEYKGEIKYVHQLQQAMRLCKIKKEIEL